MPEPPKTWSSSISAWILYASVAGAPLPFGSASASAIAFWCIVLGVGAAAASPRTFDRRHAALLGLAVLVVAAYAFVLHEQLAQHPWIATPHPLWAQASDALGTKLEPSVSIARNEPFYALGSPLCCMLAVTCGFVVCTDRERARDLMLVIAWSGAAYAAYGILAHVIDPTRILWREKEAYLSVATSTFINRNTAATYFGSCAVVWLMLLAERIRQHLPRGAIAWRKVPGRLLIEPPGAMVTCFAMLLLCLAAMFMTGSRAGVLLSLLALIVAFTLYFGRDLPRRTGIVTVLLGGAAAALVLLEFMGGGVSARIDIEGTSDSGRLATWLSTLRMIADHPWFGTGQGTFEWAYPAYRSGHISMWGVWDRAHDTLLELAADMGLPLAALVVLAWLVVFGVLVSGVRTRRRDLIIPVSAFAVAMLACLHSLVDFSLQIPGYAIVAFALVGAGLAQSFATNGGRNGSGRGSSRPDVHTTTTISAHSNSGTGSP
jgi:O-antigen ligase